MIEMQKLNEFIRPQKMNCIFKFCQFCQQLSKLKTHQIIIGNHKYNIGFTWCQTCDEKNEIDDNFYKLIKYKYGPANILQNKTFKVKCSNEIIEDGWKLDEFHPYVCNIDFEDGVYCVNSNKSIYKLIKISDLFELNSNLI